MGPYGNAAAGFRVVRNAAALGRKLQELFGSRPAAGGPAEALRNIGVDASRYAGVYASEYGCARNSSRFPRRRSRLSFSAVGYPKTSGGSA